MVFLHTESKIFHQKTLKFAHLFNALLHGYVPEPHHRTSVPIPRCAAALRKFLDLSPD